MLSSHFFEYPTERPPPSTFFNRSFAPVNDCTQAFASAACPQAQATVVYISLAAGLLLILVCLLLCACFKISVICSRQQSAHNYERRDVRQQESATQELARTDGLRLVILAGEDKPSLMAKPCAVQGKDGFAAADSGIWLSKTSSRDVDEEGRQVDAPSLSPCVSDYVPRVVERLL